MTLIAPKLDDPDDAARELMRRRRARSSLVGFAQAIDIPGKPLSEDDDDPNAWLFQPIETGMADHHRLMLEALERTVQRRHGRLMLFLPPGSAKSTYASVVAPVALMGRTPNVRVLLASYGQDLARRHGRRARAVAAQRAFRDIYSGHGNNPAEVTLNPKTSAADEWALTNGSEYLACGILASITGARAHFIFIDDPTRGREQADSPTMRDKTWAAYQDDLLTRLIPGGSVALVSTRWHEDDLAGRILPKNYEGESGLIECRDGKLWEVLCLPACCERDDDPLGRKPGEYLWPEWFDQGHWAIFRAQSRAWASLFQQRPRPDEGGIFQAAWFKRYGTAPVEGIVVQSWDTANKQKQDNAPSVCTTWLITRSAYYLLHVYRQRLEYPALKRAVISQALRYNPSAILIEDKASGQSLIQDLRDEQTLPIIAIEPDGDKLTRARRCSGVVEAGLVHVPSEAAWLPEFEGEVFAFPLSTFADQIDSLTQFLNWARQSAVNVAAIGADLPRVGISAFDDNTLEHRAAIDPYGAVGRLRSGPDLRGF
jgi:predicted phage terminase large subunit-like protein